MNMTKFLMGFGIKREPAVTGKRVWGDHIALPDKQTLNLDVKNQDFNSLENKMSDELTSSKQGVGANEQTIISDLFETENVVNQNIESNETNYDLNQDHPSKSPKLMKAIFDPSNASLKVECEVTPFASFKQKKEASAPQTPKHIPENIADDDSDIELVLVEEIQKSLIPKLKTPAKSKPTLAEFNKHVLQVAEEQARKRREDELNCRQVEQEERKKKREEKRISFRKCVDEQLLKDQLAAKELEEKGIEDDLLAEIESKDAPSTNQDDNDKKDSENVKRIAINRLELSDEDVKNQEDLGNEEAFDVDSDG